MFSKQLYNLSALGANNSKTYYNPRQKSLEHPRPSITLRCDFKVTWLKQHGKREREIRGGGILQSVSRFLSEIVAWWISYQDTTS